MSHQDISHTPNIKIYVMMSYMIITRQKKKMPTYTTQEA